MIWTISVAEIHNGAIIGLCIYGIFQHKQILNSFKLFIRGWGVSGEDTWVKLIFHINFYMLESFSKILR